MGQGEHEPRDPSSGDSAGGDITSSLTDASMACRGISSSSCRAREASTRGKLGERRGTHYGVAKANESGAMRGGDGAEGDGGGAGLAEASGIGADGFAEVTLQKGQREEAAVRLYLHLPGEPAGRGRRRFGLRRHLTAWWWQLPGFWERGLGFRAETLRLTRVYVFFEKKLAAKGNTCPLD